MHVFIAINEAKARLKYWASLYASDFGRWYYTKGTVYVMLRLTVGNVSFTVDMRPYLRASTIRRLNRALAELGEDMAQTATQCAPGR